MATSAEAPPIQREIRIAARPETIFPHLVDRERMTRWMGIAADLEPRPGGGLRIAINDRNVAAGEYVVVEPNRRVVFTWGWEVGEVAVPPGSSTVEITLTPDAGGTLLRLVHRDLPTAIARERHDHGWQHYLGRLTVAAAGGDPGPDPWAQPADDGNADGER